MFLPKRLENALNKIYTAFYEETLNPEDCKQCLVGNICDNVDAWKHLTDHHGTTELNYLGRLNEVLNKRINGYLPSELLAIEAVFLEACGYTLTSRKRLKKPTYGINSEILFSGLYDAISFLCALDNVDNVMELYQKFDLQTTVKPEFA